MYSKRLQLCKQVDQDNIIFLSKNVYHQGVIKAVFKIDSQFWEQKN